MAGMPFASLKAAPSIPKTSVILFWMAGGPSQHETYDPKSDAVAEVRGPFNSTATNVPGIRICELLPRHAKIMDKCSLIRSVTHSLSVHDDGSHWIQTGYPLFQARQRGQQNPAQGAVISALNGPNAPGLPAYVCIPEDYRSHMGFYQRASYLGSQHDAVNAGGDPKLGNYRAPQLDLPIDISFDRLEDRRALQHQLDEVSQLRDRRELSGLNSSRQQAYNLLLGENARRAFDLSKEPDRLHEKYGRHQWGRAALLSRRLVEAGVTFVTINLYEKDIDWWDDHTTIEKNMRKRLPPFDQALSTLVEDIYDRGMNDRVLIVACGEFGRSPRIDAGAGRGHWPKVMSVLMSGAIRTGRVIGSTTANGGEPRDRPVTPGDLLATIYRAVGIDHHRMLTDRQNRPVPLLPEGEPISELF